MPKYCRAPNCSNTAGRLGADNRPVSFYKVSRGPEAPRSQSRRRLPYRRIHPCPRALPSQSLAQCA
ncbi:THAP8 isoform 2 [Pan troglodytes]|uniref:THAP8 isoform 2 n=1 Tax=Pan troglodytes TaxID=9598 RepID=A0A2J8QHY3_PANTR|nr:THAP8 isoform 2 [Pan troglodytes]